MAYGVSGSNQARQARISAAIKAKGITVVQLPPRKANAR